MHHDPGDIWRDPVRMLWNACRTETTNHNEGARPGRSRCNNLSPGMVCDHPSARLPARDDGRA
eukprot:9330763-Alexandrium_andersonii.AAC.1